MARFVEIDGCPVPVALAPAVREVKRRTGATLITCYRGEDPEALRILHRNGKHSQAELYAAWERGDAARLGILGTPNRPGQSTHELRSDGRAYRGPVGRRLLSWQCGMDWPDVAIPSVMRAFAQIGAVPVHPYASGSEFHHLNLRRAPVLFRPLRRGARGPRVAILTHRLAMAGYLPHATAVFDSRVDAAVRRFQSKHVGLAVDGVVGAVTWRNVQVAASAARRKARR